MELSSIQKQAVIYREKITDEILYALGFSRSGVMRRVLGPLFRVATQRFGQIVARADDEASRTGISGASRLILPDFSLHTSVRGAENIPTEGPLLVVSNHPGGYDSLVILSCIPRKDLKIVLSDVPFTRAFTTARQYFIYVPSDPTGRMSALRSAIDHLHKGGALLIFAHGEVEPDPEVHFAGAPESILAWSRSVEAMLRKAPQAWLQVTIASGVLMRQFVDSPLVKIRRKAAKQQKLAEFLQISQQMIFPRSLQTHVHVSFARPVPAEQLPQDGIMPAVIQIGQQLLNEHIASLRP